MQNFQQFLNEVKSFESSLWKYLAGTAVLSGVLVAGQFNKFTPGFNALTEVCGVIAGMAAIIPAYMKRLVHVSKRRGKVLNYEPILLPFQTMATLVLAILAFYQYYQLTKGGFESCLFFMAAGVYLFFRVIGQSIHHFYMSASQEVIWNELSPQMQTKGRTYLLGEG